MQVGHLDLIGWLSMLWALCFRLSPKAQIRMASGGTELNHLENTELLHADVANSCLDLLWWALCFQFCFHIQRGREEKSEMRAIPKPSRRQMSRVWVWWVHTQRIAQNSATLPEHALWYGCFLMSGALVHLQWSLGHCWWKCVFNSSCDFHAEWAYSASHILHSAVVMYLHNQNPLNSDHPAQLSSIGNWLRLRKGRV